MTRIVPVTFVLFWWMTVQGDVHESGSYQRIEQLGDKTFTSKVFFDGADVTKELWVDDQCVDQATYEQQKIAAGEHDVADLARRIQKTHAAFESVIDQICTKAVLKLLIQTRDACKKLLKSLHDNVGELYFAFDQATISSAEFLHTIEYRILPVFIFCDDERAHQENPVLLKRCAQTLVSLYDHLMAFYTASIQCALEHADNPKSLQKLLDLV